MELAEARPDDCAIGNEAIGASGSGGGMSVVGGSLADFTFVVIQGNEARRGGGAWVDGSTFFIQGTPDADCGYVFGTAYEPFQDRYCAEIYDNRSADEGTVDNFGGALYATHASVTLREVGIQRNRADTDATSLYFGDGANADLRNVLVAATDDAVPVSVRVHENATMNSRMSTFGGIGTTVVFESGASGVLHGDIFWSEGGAGTGLELQGTGVTGACNVGEGDLAALGGSFLLADPQFWSTSRGYYRLRYAPPGIVSPAIDFCNNGPSIDLDGEARPQSGPNDYDAGAFEVAF